MKISRWRVLLLLAVLPLAGCFQQAGDSLQSTGNTAIPITSQPTDSQPQINPDDANPTADSEDPLESDTTPTDVTIQQSGPTTATLPPITIIVQPTDVPGASSENETPDAPSSQTDTQQTTFITPGISLGPDIATETPDPLSGEPTTTPSGLITPTSLFAQSQNVSDECTYTVQSGDNLFRIAVNNDTSVDEMRAVNPELTGTNPVIQPGQVLVLPNCDATASGSSTIDEEAPTPVPPIMTPAGGPPASGSDGATGSQVYVVQRGDTLFTIAQRFGVSIADIVAANELLDPDRLDVGQELFIPQDGNG